MTTRQVKAAEAAEEVAKAQARQRLVLADADLEAAEVADKQSRAKVRLAPRARRPRRLRRASRRRGCARPTPRRWS
jgi:hypothetical protein